MTNRTVPTAVSHAASDLITGASWNAGAVATNAFFTNVPIFAATSTNALSVAAVGIAAVGPYTSIPLNTTIVDSDSGHSNVANSTRYTVQVGGYYMIAGAVAWSTNATGDRAALIAINGFALAETINTYIASPGSDPTIVPVKTFVQQLNPGDYVELQGSQSSGGALSTTVAATPGTASAGCWLHMWWLAHA